ncbi:MAG: glutathione S-transferase C-terminal domain-containing protein [Myxococcota bacterium]
MTDVEPTALRLAPGDPRAHFLLLRRALGATLEAPVVRLVPHPDGRLVGPDGVATSLSDYRGPARERLVAGLSEVERARVEDLHDRLLVPVEAVAEATEAVVYAEGYRRVFATLDALETSLGAQRFLAGGRGPTAADWFLYVVLLRFDPVYSPLYKLNRGRIDRARHLGPYLRDLYARDPAVDLVDFVAIKRHYFWADTEVNHRRVVPRGGVPDLARPHDRDRFDMATDRARSVEEAPSAPARPGSFVRGVSRHRHTIEPDLEARFPAEAGRYHLYIANNCPWCHRVALTRALKGLEDVVTMDVLHYRRDPERGWTFRPEVPGCTEDSVFGATFVREIYAREQSTERSVPLLIDRRTQSIVNNESAEIIRMLDRAFEAFAPDAAPRLCPPERQAEIDALNAWVYTDINNGAYKAGFAHDQVAYDIAFARFFAALARLEAMLADGRPYLLGDALSEADVRLFPTIFRFDPVYFTRFRLNGAMVRDHVRLSAWHDRMLALPAVARASNLDHCRQGYFGRTGNGIVPLGPEEALSIPRAPDQ